MPIMEPKELNLLSPQPPLFLGLDLGSVSLKAVVLDQSAEIAFESYRRTEGQPVLALAALFDELRARLGNPPIHGLIITGSGKDTLAGPLGAGKLNEIVAHARAAWTLHPDVRSVIEIGGQDSKFIRIGRDRAGRPYVEDHAFNELCAAGTGAFLDQQAARLGLSIQDFGEIAGRAKHAARLAGRCAVFAKSDMIHLHQQACPNDEIAAGLCFALARTYLANLCRGVRPAAPVLFQGGVAANEGVARAFRELLGLTDADFIRPGRHDVMGAWGAALAAREAPWERLVSLEELAARLNQLESVVPPPVLLAPLTEPSSQSAPLAPSPQRDHDTALYLGLDVGSVSTKAAVLNDAAEVVAASYVPTAGQPLTAIPAALDALRAQLPAHARFKSLVTTGSGRHLAAEALAATEAVDEITCQTRAARQALPDVDTVIEIGGQDSKYIHMVGENVARFQMNRACAAGTGSFLEEQAGRLGIAIDREFASLALASRTPVELGSRCTVFMDSDLVHHIQHGVPREDLCAGLAYAIAKNYLEKVVGSRPVGTRILFQGGVARNRAVHAAFEALLGKRITVHPHPEISGAFGAALLAREGAQASPQAQVERSLDSLTFDATTSTFVCRACENVCEIQNVSFGGRRQAFFGSVCGRFEKGSAEPLAAEDLFTIRERLLLRPVEAPVNTPSRGSIGFPFALSLTDHLPFWRTFFTKLGYEVVLSGHSNRELVETGLSQVPGEFCYPVKVFFGHLHTLEAKGLPLIFVPHLRMFEQPGENEVRYACPYTQAAPYIARQNRTATLLSLEYPVRGEEAFWAQEAAKTLAAPHEAVWTALGQAQAAQEAFHRDCRAEGARALETLRREKRPGAVLLGRPYNTSDRTVNLQLARRLQALGIEPIPYDFLPLEDEPLPPLWSRVRWGYGRQLLKAARLLKRESHLSAVIVTNFGCGPDSFVDQYLEQELSATPHVLLEFDDHQAVAGLLTRLEAFARTLKAAHPRESENVWRADPGKSSRPRRELTYYIPNFCDHARAFTGALRASGCRAVLLPPTDEESWRLGLRHAYGRECHPFICFTGDLLKAAARPDFDAENACYYGPSYFGSCLLPQYMLALRMILDRVGLERVIVINIADPPTMKELGNAYVTRLALGLYAIDRLYKWKVESEPYELVPGEVARVHEENMQRIEEGLANRQLFRAIKQSVARFKAVKLAPDAGSRPKIGVVGDVYTRVNTQANSDLYARLKGLGFEVWPSCTLVDVSFLGIEQLHAELRRSGHPLKAFAAKGLIPLVAFARWCIDRYFPSTIRTPQERQYPDIVKVSEHYASHWIDKALALNLSRIEELHQAGASGVINAMCHNCMLGTVTGALSGPLREDMPGLTLCSLVYEGLQSTHSANRLEALAHQIGQTHPSVQLPPKPPLPEGRGGI